MRRALTMSEVEHHIEASIGTRTKRNARTKSNGASSGDKPKRSPPFCAFGYALTYPDFIEFAKAKGFWGESRSETDITTWSLYYMKRCAKTKPRCEACTIYIRDEDGEICTRHCIALTNNRTQETTDVAADTENSSKLKAYLEIDREPRWYVLQSWPKLYERHLPGE
ncbi:hypothetical protein BOTBODRAFT_37643, partial [Botryobasidium botryosum FD-172 SS1]